MCFVRQSSMTTTTTILSYQSYLIAILRMFFNKTRWLLYFSSPLIRKLNFDARVKGRRRRRRKKKKKKKRFNDLSYKVRCAPKTLDVYCRYHKRLALLKALNLLARARFVGAPENPFFNSRLWRVRNTDHYYYKTIDVDVPWYTVSI